MMKVFLVDDEIVIREGIRTSFPWEKTEYNLVGEAPDGEMALPMIRDTNPDIVITDIRMPFMDGIELCKALRTQMPWISVIILSGYDEFEYARKGIQLGVREYLLKPITAEDLRKALDRVSETILEERKTRERGHGMRIEGDGAFLREKLISSLYSEDAAETDAENTLQQLRAMGIQVYAPRYAVIDAAFDPPDRGRGALNDLAESSGGIVHASASRTGSRVLVLGDTDEDTEERAYAFASSIARELERMDCGGIRVAIGEIVDHPRDIVKSFRTARHIRHTLADQEGGNTRPVIVGVRELGEMPSDKKSPSIVAEARYYMSQHYTDPNLMLQDVAKAVNMSNSRFSTVFAQQSGKTFTEYITGLRLGKAKELLRETDLRSSQIAFEVGYNDAHYFSYLFKKSFGLTPGEYRSSHK